MLGDLRSFRVKAKALARELSGSARRNVEALQQTFKILINSFYGYLGFSLGHFNDFDQANAVTRRGRELIQAAIAELEEPRRPGDRGRHRRNLFRAAGQLRERRTSPMRCSREIAATMPAGIRLEIDGKYAAMFSYKMKNYVLARRRGRDDDSRLGPQVTRARTFPAPLHGGPVPPADERIATPSWRICIAGYLAHIATSRNRYRRTLMKTETLQDSLDNYREKVGGKRRNASAAYELALKSSRAYVAGDQISYYVSGRGAKVKVATAAQTLRPSTTRAVPTRTSSTIRPSSPTCSRNFASSPPARIVRGLGTGRPSGEDATHRSRTFFRILRSRPREPSCAILANLQQAPAMARTNLPKRNPARTNLTKQNHHEDKSAGEKLR